MAAAKGASGGAEQLPIASLSGDVNLAADDIGEKMAQLSAGDDPQRAAIAGLRGDLLRLAFDARGCRLVQAALGAAGREEQEALVLELQGHVWAALESHHANFVIQKVVEVMPPPLVAFVVEELTGKAVQAALHRFGCRVLCRLVEHCPSEQIGPLFDEVLQEAAALCRHGFGNHVVRHILEHGTAEQRKTIAHTLLAEPLRFASHRTASCVMELALSHCASEERNALLAAFLHNGNALAQLACGRYGSYVVRALLALPNEEAAGARLLLAKALPTLQGSPHGRRVRRVLADLGDDVIVA